MINLEKKSPGSDVQTQKVARSNPDLDGGEDEDDDDDTLTLDQDDLEAAKSQE